MTPPAAFYIGFGAFVLAAAIGIGVIAGLVHLVRALTPVAP